MHSIRHDRKLTPYEFAAFKESARANALQLRRDAQVAFWNEVSARLHRAWNRLLASPGAVFDRPVDPSWPHGTR